MSDTYKMFVAQCITKMFSNQLVNLWFIHCLEELELPGSCHALGQVIYMCANNVATLAVIWEILLIYVHLLKNIFRFEYICICQQNQPEVL